jgi:hypothetical protein
MDVFVITSEKHKVKSKRETALLAPPRKAEEGTK